MAINPEMLTALFGDSLPMSDKLRQSSGDVSQTGKALNGPGGPFDDQILATVDKGKGAPEPARLSPGEFVFKQPAVAFLGDGDPDVGAAYLDTLQNNPDALSEVRSVLAKYMNGAPNG